MHCITVRQLSKVLYNTAYTHVNTATISFNITDTTPAAPRIIMCLHCYHELVLATRSLKSFLKFTK